MQVLSNKSLFCDRLHFPSNFVILIPLIIVTDIISSKARWCINLDFSNRCVFQVECYIYDNDIAIIFFQGSQGFIHHKTGIAIIQR